MKKKMWSPAGDGDWWFETFTKAIGDLELTITRERHNIKRTLCTVTWGNYNYWKEQ